MSSEDNSKKYGRAELVALLGGLEGEALTEHYRITPAGVVFEPDPVTWSTLTDEERLAVMPAGWEPSHPVLPFPFSLQELICFIESSQLPKLLYWCEQDGDEPSALRGLEDHPTAHSLARLLATTTGHRSSPHASGDPSAEALPAAPPSATPPYSTRVVRHRTNLLAPLIDDAVAEVGDAPPRVFNKLRQWANEKRQPLLGVAPDGLQWLDANDEPQMLTLKNLRDRLRNRRAKAR